MSAATTNWKSTVWQILVKGIAPTTILSVIVGMVNAYINYRDMRIEVANTTETVASLRADIRRLKDADIAADRHVHDNFRVTTDAIRDRFEQDERAVIRLQGALGNLQTEVRIRHGVMPDAMPDAVARLPRSQQVEAAASQVDRAMAVTGRAIPRDEPLAELSQGR